MAYRSLRVTSPGGTESSRPSTTIPSDFGSARLNIEDIEGEQPTTSGSTSTRPLVGDRISRLGSSEPVAAATSMDQ